MTWNICYRCGYDLTGLDLPRRCPECGQLCDPQAESEEAIRWCRKWWAPAALFYPEPIPGGLWFVTDDDGSLRRLARRRLLVWVWLPVVLNMLLVGAGHFIEVNYNGDVDRLYAFELDIFPSRQSAWETPWRVSVPEHLDTFTLSMALVPLILTGIAWMVPSRLMSLSIRRRGRPPNVGRFQLSLASPLLGIICWFWLLSMLEIGVTDAFNLTSLDGMECISYALMGVWLLLGAVAYPRIIFAEKSGTLFGSRWRMAILVALILIGGPLLVVFLMN